MKNNKKNLNDEEMELISGGFKPVNEMGLNELGRKCHIYVKPNFMHNHIVMTGRTMPKCLYGIKPPPSELFIKSSDLSRSDLQKINEIKRKDME